MFVEHKLKERRLCDILSWKQTQTPLFILVTANHTIFFQKGLQKQKQQQPSPHKKKKKLTQAGAKQPLFSHRFHWYLSGFRSASASNVKKQAL